MSYQPKFYLDEDEMKFIPERSEYDKWMRSTTSIKYNEYRYGELTASEYFYNIYFGLDKLGISIWPIVKNRRISIWMKIA